MIDLKTEAPFGLGEKVSHKQYGLGQIVGVDFGRLSVMFAGGEVYQFYGDDMPTPTISLLISELKYVGQWVEIDWDNESTLPNWDLVLVYCGYIDFDSLMNGKGGIGFAEHGRNVTHWQPLPKIPSYSYE